MRWLNRNIHSLPRFSSGSRPPYQVSLTEIGDLSLPTGVFVVAPDGLLLSSSRSSSRIGLFDSPSIFPFVHWTQMVGGQPRNVGYAFEII
jgi:hypothetical protein